MRSLCVVCELYHDAAVLNVDGYCDAVPVPAFGPRMVCTRCGIVGATHSWCASAELWPRSITTAQASSAQQRLPATARPSPGLGIERSESQHHSRHFQRRWQTVA